MFIKPTVYIGKDTLIFYSKNERESFSFSLQNSSQAVSTLKDRGVTEVQLILSPYYTYSLGLLFDKEQTLSRDMVREGLQYKVPEVFDDTHFDWALQATDDAHAYVQASVIKPDFYAHFFSELKKYDINVLFSKPVEIVLLASLEHAAESLPSSCVLCVADPEPMFIYYADYTVWLSGLWTRTDVQFSEYTQFARGEHLPEPTHIFYDQVFAHNTAAQTFFSSIPEGLELQQVALDVFKTAVLFSSEKGADKNIMDFALARSQRSFLLFHSLLLTIFAFFVFVGSVVVTVLFLH